MDDASVPEPEDPSNCGSCCLFARSGETGYKGVPGEAGNPEDGVLPLGWSSLDCEKIE